MLVVKLPGKGIYFITEAYPTTFVTDFWTSRAAPSAIQGDPRGHVVSPNALLSCLRRM
jgi:hypothetical protein